MPFQSEKQRRYLWANEPEIARDWTNTYGSRIQRDNGGITNPRLLPHQPRDLLVQNSPYGTRPRYQPPGHRDAPVGGPPGGGATSQGSGRDAPGSDRGPRDAPDRHGPVQTVTQSTGGDRIIDVAQRKQRQNVRDLIAQQQAEKDYTPMGQIKPGPQLGLARSGIGGGLGNWASQFAGSKIGGGLGSMLFGPWGMLLGAMFGRGVGKRAYGAYQTKDKKESLQDILLGENNVLSSMFNKKKTPTPTGEGLGGIDLSDMRDKIYQEDPGAVGIENKFTDDYNYRPSEKMYWDEQQTSMPKNLGASISELENWMRENPQHVQQKHINFAQALQTAQHNKALEEDPNRPGLRVGQLWE